MSWRRRSPVVARCIALAGALAFAPAAEAQANQDPSRFQHEVHASYQCGECHGTGRPTTASNRTWCADCHHVDVSYTQCQRCHDPTAIAPEAVRAQVTFRLSVADDVTRSLTFEHQRHLDLGCANCHAGGFGLGAVAECTTCHVDHHEPGRACTACHSEPPTTAHPKEIHLDLAGCGAAGCHVSEGLDYAALEDERMLCLSCHVAQTEHETADPCAECHLLEAPPDPMKRRR